MHGQHPNTVRLPIHLENQQNIMFNEEKSINHESILSKAHTQLTEFFEINKNDNFSKTLQYHDIPKHYSWDQKNKKWKKRTRKSEVIGRIHFIHPADLEKFSLRTLLLHRKGPTSFADLMTIDNKTYNSCREACCALGLIENDNEYDNCLSEAASVQTNIGSLRNLFSIILINCQVIDPKQLWEKYKFALTEDILHETREKHRDQNIDYNDNMFNLCLHYIDLILLKNGQKLSNFPGMPTYQITNDMLDQINHSNLIFEELNYDEHVLKKQLSEYLQLLNSDQKRIYDTIISSVENENC